MGFPKIFFVYCMASARVPGCEGTPGYFSYSGNLQTDWMQEDLFSISTNPNSIGRHLGVCHADDLFYLWDMYGLNAELGLLDRVRPNTSKIG